MTSRRWQSALVAGALALGCALLPGLAQAAAETSPTTEAPASETLFRPTEDEVRRYLVVLPALLRETENGPAALTRETMVRLAHDGGFADLERFARTHAAVLAAYACLQAEAMRDDLARQSRNSPETLAGPWRDRRRELNDKIEALRRHLAPETLALVRPHLPALAHLLAETETRQNP